MAVHIVQECQILLFRLKKTIHFSGTGFADTGKQSVIDYFAILPMEWAFLDGQITDKAGC